MTLNPILLKQREWSEEDDECDDSTASLRATVKNIRLIKHHQQQHTPKKKACKRRSSTSATSSKPSKATRTLSADSASHVEEETHPFTDDTSANGVDGEVASSSHVEHQQWQPLQQQHDGEGVKHLSDDEDMAELDEWLRPHHTMQLVNNSGAPVSHHLPPIQHPSYHEQQRTAEESACHAPTLTADGPDHPFQPPLATAPITHHHSSAHMSVLAHSREVDMDELDELEQYISAPTPASATMHTSMHGVLPGVADGSKSSNVPSSASASAVLEEQKNGVVSAMENDKQAYVQEDDADGAGQGEQKREEEQKDCGHFHHAVSPAHTFTETTDVFGAGASLLSCEIDALKQHHLRHFASLSTHSPPQQLTELMSHAAHAHVSHRHSSKRRSSKDMTHHSHDQQADVWQMESAPDQNRW